MASAPAILTRTNQLDPQLHWPAPPGALVAPLSIAHYAGTDWKPPLSCQAETLIAECEIKTPSPASKLGCGQPGQGAARHGEFAGGFAAGRPPRNGEML